IFAYGFRNPWRMSIDLEDDTVWLGDVGFSNAEEVDRVEAGGNYGWSVLEGSHCLNATDCPSEGFAPPLYEFPHTEGRCAAVGGLVYRGDAIEGLGGRYVFGDLCTGQIWALPRSARAGDDIVPLLLADLDGMLVTFGVDADGEVLVADYEGGGIYRLVPE
ncbi:MAG: PQQ-dependent sugar dehydrogenase, partial [Dehalococcoidia bacterium]|nr:PQQ-dependent sugar dehydrogenase [Dehalococcoidia bacterium]